MAASIRNLVLIEELLEDEEEEDSETTDLPLPLLASLVTMTRAGGVKNETDFFENVLNLPPNLFRYHCRLSKYTFQLLVNELSLGLSQNYGHGGFTDIPIDMQAMVFLWYISNQTSMRHIAWDFGLAKSTVHEIVHAVASELVKISHKFIQ
ncbi:hypothetical protein SNE40_021954 [Patella caerulea]|uniref:Transposase Helix-turn-helix domain-containing protein n=1 Tax=Patella caerulea TaxID=87958 RepID=A0AAN8G154_PATCE